MEKYNKTKLYKVDNFTDNTIPDFAIEITEFYANHCTVGTYGETIDAPTGAPHVFRKHPQYKRLADFKRF